MPQIQENLVNWGVRYPPPPIAPPPPPAAPVHPPPPSHLQPASISRASVPQRSSSLPVPSRSPSSVSCASLSTPARLISQAMLCTVSSKRWNYTTLESHALDSRTRTVRRHCQYYHPTSSNFSLALVASSRLRAFRPYSFPVYGNRPFKQQSELRPPHAETSAKCYGAC